MKEEKLKERDEMVSCLLEELVKVRQNLAESEDTIRNLKTKIQELEEVRLQINFLITFSKKIVKKYLKNYIQKLITLGQENASRNDSR